MGLWLAILLVAAAGSASNWINWRFLNYGPVRLLYYVGAFVHEASHAIACLATGARIEEFRPFSAQPRVVHGKPRIPLVGNALISSAPILGGLLFVYALDRLFLGGLLDLSPVASDWRSIAGASLDLVSRLDPREWQSWALAALTLNAGAMIGPSPQDLKGMWPALVALFFMPSPPLLVGLCLSALALIVANVAIQTALAAVIALARALRG